MSAVPQPIRHLILRGLSAAALFLCLLLPGPWALAQQAETASEQAVVEFDGNVTGDLDGNFTVRGNVRFTYENTQIRSDTMVVEAGGDVVHFFGNVVVSTPDQEIYGERFVYDMPAGTSLLFQPRGELEVESVEGPVYYRGQTLSVEEQRIVLTGAMFTTCECDPPGYYVAGSRMEIIPNVSMTLYNVRFVESGLTLFYWPKLTVPLYTSARPPFRLPEIGHSGHDGWYVKLSFPYEAFGAGGLLLLDWFQRKGVGAGVTHWYRDDNSGMGQVHVYALLNRQTQTIDPALGWAGRLSSNPWNASWELDYFEEGFYEVRRRTAEGSLSLRNTRPDGYVTLSASGAREATPSALRTSLSGSVRLNQRLPNGLLLNVTADTVLRLGYPVERRLYGYSFDLQGGSAPIIWRIVANERFHPDLAKEQATGTPSWMSSGSRPEITVSATPSPTLLGTRIPLTFEVGWGRFSERHAQGVTVDTRATALAQLRTLSLPVSRQLTLSATGYARGYWYGSGSERTVLASTLTATYRPSSNISVRSTYEWLEQIGESPFRFDRTTPRHRVRGSVSYTGDVVSLSASSGYNLLTQAPENLTVSAGIEPLEQVSLRASGVYSLAQHRPVSATAALEIDDGERFALRLGGSYSFVREQFDKVVGGVQLSLGGWKVGYEAIYDAAQDEFERGAFTLLRDLDCRLIGLSYDQAKGEVWLEYRITAIPTMGLRLGSDQGGLLFDLEGWEELLQE